MTARLSSASHGRPSTLGRGAMGNRMRETAGVAAQGIRKEYGPVVAVDELSFEAEPGEILGVLGPNGAGKTTAIRVLTTILPPTSGEFRVAGRSEERRVGKECRSRW